MYREGYSLGLSKEGYKRILAGEDSSEKGLLIKGLYDLYMGGAKYVGDVLQSISSIVLSLVSVIVQPFSIPGFPSPIPMGVIFAIILVIVLAIFVSYFRQTSISEHQMKRIGPYGLVSIFLIGLNIVIIALYALKIFS
jgi:hypothetical protein